MKTHSLQYCGVARLEVKAHIEHNHNFLHCISRVPYLQEVLNKNLQTGESQLVSFIAHQVIEVYTSIVHIKLTKHINEKVYYNTSTCIYHIDKYGLWRRLTNRHISPE